MKWTTDKPTKPGWYWVRWPIQPQYGPEILVLNQPNGPDTDELDVGYEPLNESLDVYISENGPIEWQGPIEPEEV